MIRRLFKSKESPMTGSNKMKTVTSRILNTGICLETGSVRSHPNRRKGTEPTPVVTHGSSWTSSRPAGARSHQSCGSDFTQRSPRSAGQANAAPSHHIFLRSSKRAFTRTERQTAIFCEAVYRNAPPERGSAAPTPNAAPVLTAFHTLCIKINIKPLRRFLKRILILWNISYKTSKTRQSI